MNVKGEFCPDCNIRMIRIVAHKSVGSDIQIGYHCEGCKTNRDLQGRELRPVVPLKGPDVIRDLLDKQFHEGMNTGKIPKNSG